MLSAILSRVWARSVLPSSNGENCFGRSSPETSRVKDRRRIRRLLPESRPIGDHLTFFSFDSLLGFWPGARLRNPTAGQQLAKPASCKVFAQSGKGERSQREPRSREARYRRSRVGKYDEPQAKRIYAPVFGFDQSRPAMIGAAVNAK